MRRRCDHHETQALRLPHQVRLPNGTFARHDLPRREDTIEHAMDAWCRARLPAGDFYRFGVWCFFLAPEAADAFAAQFGGRVELDGYRAEVRRERAARRGR